MPMRLIAHRRGEEYVVVVEDVERERGSVCPCRSRTNEARHDDNARGGVPAKRHSRLGSPGTSTCLSLTCAFHNDHPDRFTPQQSRLVRVSVCQHDKQRLHPCQRRRRYHARLSGSGESTGKGLVDQGPQSLIGCSSPHAIRSPLRAGGTSVHKPGLDLRKGVVLIVSVVLLY